MGVYNYSSVPPELWIEMRHLCLDDINVCTGRSIPLTLLNILMKKQNNAHPPVQKLLKKLGVRQVVLEARLSHATVSKWCNCASPPFDFVTYCIVMAGINNGRQAAQFYRACGYDILAEIQGYDTIWTIIENQDMDALEKVDCLFEGGCIPKQYADKDSL